MNVGGGTHDATSVGIKIEAVVKKGLTAPPRLQVGQEQVGLMVIPASGEHPGSIDIRLVGN
jgi:hypothetical protein